MRKRSEAKTEVMDVGEMGMNNQRTNPEDPFDDAPGSSARENESKTVTIKMGNPVGPAPKVFEFETAHGAKEERLAAGMERLVERTFIDDPEATYDRLERALKVGEKRSDHGTLQQQLDEAEWNARDAFKLWRTAQLVVKQWEHDNQVVNSAMRKEATHALEAEKESGVRKKAITNDDVEAMIATMYPEEYRAQQSRRLKVHSLERSCENLNDLWNSRCRTLAVMAGRQR